MPHFIGSILSRERPLHPPENVRPAARKAMLAAAENFFGLRKTGVSLMRMSVVQIGIMRMGMNHPLMPVEM